MEDINDILGKHFSGEASAQEEQQVLQWKKKHEQEYVMLEKAWNETIDFDFKTYDDTKAWKKISDRLDSPETKVFSLTRGMKMAIAASFAVLIGLTLTWYLSGTDFIQVMNATNQTEELTLPDGTQIWLSAGSELEYASDFKTNRKVRLQGTAFFEVAKDAKHPFTIKTPTSEVEVLGTGFNVVSAADYTTVSVKHGLVALRNETKEVKLGEGQMARATADEISPVMQLAPNTTSWIDGSFDFDHTPLPEVIRQLNTYYSKKIVLGSEHSKNKELTAKFKNQSLEEVIEIITLSCDLESEFNEDSVVLK